MVMSQSEQGQGNANMIIEITSVYSKLNFVESTAANNSLVVVLPFVPVIPMIGNQYLAVMVR